MRADAPCAPALRRPRGGVAVTILVALLSAALYGTGAALQERQAATVPAASPGRPPLLLLLVRRPWWLLGFAAQLGGFAAHTVALHGGSLAIVQLVLASSLIFSVSMVRWWTGQPLGRSGWVGALAVVAGTGAFLAFASPSAAVLDRSDRLVGAAVVTGAGAALLAGIGLLADRRRAALLAVAAGLSSTSTAVVTMAFSHVVGGGVAAVIGSWTTYALVGGGLCSLLLAQRAFQTAQPMTTLPALTVVTPLASLAVGVGLLGETVHVGAGREVAGAVALVVVVVGLVTLSRSPCAAGAGPGAWEVGETLADEAGSGVRPTPSVTGGPAAMPDAAAVGDQMEERRAPAWGQVPGVAVVVEPEP